MNVFQKILGASVSALSVFTGITSLSTGGQFGETVGWSPDRGSIMYYLPQDSRQYLSQWTRVEILRKVEWLFQTFGIVKEGIRGIARHSVGDNGICLQLNSDDEEWNELAEADFEQFAKTAARFDIAGRRNFYQAQEHAIEQRIKMGEFFASHASNPRWDGEPCVQLWDALEVESPTAEMNPNIIDGVLVDEHTNPLGYYVRTINGTHKFISAEKMMHWYHADGTNQVRGVSELAQAVNPLVDTKELIQITTKTAKQNTAIGLHIKKMVKAGGNGGLDRLSTISGNKTEGTTTTAAGAVDPQYEKLTGGGAIIYTAEDGDAKLLTPTSPTPLLEPFITKVLMRNALASLGVPSEFFWAFEDLNGVAQRVVLVKADALFRKLGSDLTVQFCDPIAVKYLLHRMATEKLRQCKDPNWLLKMEWQLPGRLSVDNGRDSAAEIQQLANGIETLRGINDRRGRGWRKQIRQWFMEFKFAAATAKNMDVEWALKYWRATMPGAGTPGADPEEDPPKPEKKPPAKTEKPTE
ncbi:MAG TPA: phage portal protein [Chthoniobacteraceae bacterium]|jgi:capsid protein